MKDTVLERKVNVWCWNVLGEISRAIKRDELRVVLIRASEKGATDTEDVADHLLFDPRSRKMVADRLLRIATNYRLLQEDKGRFTLTDTGNAALQRGEILVPEYGPWTIWVSDDPLLQHPVLRIEPWIEPKAIDEVRQGKRGSDDRKFEQVPDKLRGVFGREGTPCCGDGSVLRVEVLEDKVESRDPGADVRIVWNVDRGEVRLEGTIGGNSVNSVLDPPEITREDVLKQLLESERLWDHWDRQSSALRVGFAETSASERESLLRDLTIKSPRLRTLRAFDQSAVGDVPLLPRTASDAGEWAAWRLESRVTDYATRERFDAWVREATEPFFSAHRVSLPSRTDLASDAWTRRGAPASPTAWYLVAAEDWSL